MSNGNKEITRNLNFCCNVEAKVRLKLAPLNNIPQTDIMCSRSVYYLHTF